MLAAYTAVIEQTPTPPFSIEIIIFRPPKAAEKIFGAPAPKKSISVTGRISDYGKSPENRETLA